MKKWYQMANGLKLYSYSEFDEAELREAKANLIRLTGSAWKYIPVEGIPSVYVNIVMYDPKCTKAPYEFITLKEGIRMELPCNDEGGSLAADKLREICQEHAHVMKSYSGSGTQKDPHEVVVFGGGWTLEDQKRAESPMTAYNRLLLGIY